MDLSLVADPVGLGFSRFSPINHLSIIDSPSDQSSAVLRISAAIINSIARPPVKRNSNRVTNRLKLKRKRRVKRNKRSSDDDSAGDSVDGEDYGFFGDSGGDGFFGDAGGDSGGGFFGGGGRGGNGDGFGGNWEDDEFFMSDDSSGVSVWFKDVIVWIVIAGCMHFSIQRVMEIMEDGIGEAGREKVQPLC